MLSVHFDDEEEEDLYLSYSAEIDIIMINMFILMYLCKVYEIPIYVRYKIFNQLCPVCNNQLLHNGP